MCNAWTMRYGRYDFLNSFSNFHGATVEVDMDPVFPNPRIGGAKSTTLSLKDSKTSVVEAGLVQLLQKAAFSAHPYRMLYWRTCR
jgi:hypothetical protein